MSKPIEEWSAKEIAVYAVNCDNSEERIDEVAMMIECHRRSLKEESKNTKRRYRIQWLKINNNRPVGIPYYFVNKEILLIRIN